MSDVDIPDLPPPDPPLDVPAKPPVLPVGVAKPTKHAAADEDIERQLAEAMAGMDAKALLGEPQRRGPKEKQPADAKKKGRVVAIHHDDIFVDVGGRSQGVISAVQFPDGPPAIGSEVEVTIEGYDNANGLLLLTRKGAAVHVDWSSVAEGMIVEARVTGTNKGGLEVEVNGIRGFMPISHIDLYRVEDAKPYISQRLLCQVTDVNPLEKNLVVSRRALLEKEREEAREKLWQNLKEGQIHKGIVRNVREFGAFVDLGGVDGLLHVSEMSWTRVANAADLLQPGQSLEVVVLKIDHDKRKISLGYKQLQKSPWDDLDLKFPPNAVVKGKVTKLMDFGAFVELEPGIEGLVHISELAAHRVQKVSSVVQPGQEVTVRVLKLEPSLRRISLSIRSATTPEPDEEAAAESGEPEPERKPPPRKTPLKGGLG